MNEVISEGAIPEETERAKELLEKLAEYKHLAKIEEMEEENYNMIDNVLNNGVEKAQREEIKKEQVWLFAPQTINSALKALEKQGLIALDLVPNSRKSKQFFFTEAGEKLVKEKIAPLVQAEEQSFLRLDERERNELLAITQKHISILEEEINKIL